MYYSHKTKQFYKKVKDKTSIEFFKTNALNSIDKLKDTIEQIIKNVSYKNEVYTLPNDDIFKVIMTMTNNKIDSDIIKNYVEYRIKKPEKNSISLETKKPIKDVVEIIEEILDEDITDTSPQVSPKQEPEPEPDQRKQSKPLFISRRTPDKKTNQCPKCNKPICKSSTQCQECDRKERLLSDKPKYIKKKSNNCVDCNAPILKTSTRCKTCKKIHQQKDKPKKKCLDCRCDIFKYSKRCPECEKTRRLNNPMSSKKPPVEQLRKDLHKYSSMEQIGKNYGVSGNSVRKWIKTYNKILNDKLPTGIVKRHRL